MALNQIHVSTPGNPTTAVEKFEPRNNVVRYSRANYTPTVDDNGNGLASSAAAVATSVDRLSRSGA